MTYFAQKQTHNKKTSKHQKATNTKLFSLAKETKQLIKKKGNKKAEAIQVSK